MIPMRPITIERNFLKSPSGSCLISFGDTKVICTATIEESVPPFLEGTGSGWVTAEYAMLPGSTSGGRKRREIGKRDGRSTEIQRLIGRSLRAAVDLKTLGQVSIIIDCDVMQADGGTRTAAISGGWVALYDALGKRSSPDTFLLGQVAAVSVGIVGSEIICDLDYANDSRAVVDMNVVKRDGDLVEVQGTAEKGVFSREELDKLLTSADAGIETIFAAQRTALGI